MSARQSTPPPQQGREWFLRGATDRRGSRCLGRRRGAEPRPKRWPGAARSGCRRPCPADPPYSLPCSNAGTGGAARRAALRLCSGLQRLRMYRIPRLELAAPTRCQFGGGRGRRVGPRGARAHVEQRYDVPVPVRTMRLYRHRQVAQKSITRPASLSLGPKVGRPLPVAYVWPHERLLWDVMHNPEQP